MFYHGDLRLSNCNSFLIANHRRGHDFFNRYINWEFTNSNGVSDILISNNSYWDLILKHQYRADLLFRHHFSYLIHGIFFATANEVFNDFNWLKFEKLWRDFLRPLFFCEEFTSVLSGIRVSGIGSKIFNEKLPNSVNS